MWTKNQEKILGKLLAKIQNVHTVCKNVDKELRDDTREVACKAPLYAYCYAEVMDKCPREDTRNAACKDPLYAYWYALKVDKCPRDDTEK